MEKARLGFALASRADTLAKASAIWLAPSKNGSTADTMNVDQILATLNGATVDYLLIGGMNFLLRHLPELTFDVDIWVRDTPENLERLNRALRKLGAAWGSTEENWSLVAEDWRWLTSQGMFCLTTDYGALDVFRDVRGLEGRYEECLRRSVKIATATGVPLRSLSDEDMLACQEALPSPEQKPRRMEILREAIRRRTNDGLAR